MCAAAALAATNTPRTLTATVLSKSSSENWSTVAHQQHAGAVDQDVQAAEAFGHAVDGAGQRTASEASALSAMALPPRASISATSASAAMADAP
jgi:hypothetical protein